MQCLLWFWSHLWTRHRIACVGVLEGRVRESILLFSSSGYELFCASIAPQRVTTPTWTGRRCNSLKPAGPRRSQRLLARHLVPWVHQVPCQEPPVGLPGWDSPCMGPMVGPGQRLHHLWVIMAHMAIPERLGWPTLRLPEPTWLPGRPGWGSKELQPSMCLKLPERCPAPPGWRCGDGRS